MGGRVISYNLERNSPFVVYSSVSLEKRVQTCTYHQEVERFDYFPQQAQLLPFAAWQAALAVFLQMTKWRLGEIALLPEITQPVSIRSEIRTFIKCLLVRLPAACRSLNLHSPTGVAWREGTPCSKTEAQKLPTPTVRLDKHPPL